MEIVRTIRLPLRPNAAGRAALLATLDAYALGCNTARDVAEANGRTRNAMTLQRLCYRQVRAVSGLPAQLAVSAIRQVAATYKTLRAAKRPDVPEFRPTCVTLQGGERARDFRILPDQRLSISTVKGRVKVPYRCGEFQRRYLADGWLPEAARLVRRGDTLTLDITLSQQVQETVLTDRAGIVGCDMGQNVLATIGGPDGKCRFFGGGKVKNSKRHYRRVRKSLQAKGTKGAKRLLKHLSGKERRFQRDVNHCTSKAIVAFAGRYERPVIALEELTDIRERARQRREQRYEFHSWAFAQLRTFIAYKAQRAGVFVAAINPRNTSKTCSRCGHLADGQRRRHDFACSACGFRLHSDLNASRNIALRLRTSRHDLEVLGSQSMTPEATDLRAE